jgi:hypothetical protein
MASDCAGGSLCGNPTLAQRTRRNGLSLLLCSSNRLDVDLKTLATAYSIRAADVSASYRGGPYSRTVS